jgi:hypothetical protein
MPALRRGALAVHGDSPDHPFMQIAARPPFPWRRVVRFSPYVVGGGLAVGMLMNGLKWNPRVLVLSAYIAILCFFFAFLFGWLADRWIGERTWLRIAVYFAGSQVGWPIGVFTGIYLLWGERLGISMLSRNTWIVVVATGVLGAFAGAALYAFELIKERLARSIVQLKEREWTEKELTLAREFQARMMPDPEIVAAGYRIDARNVPAHYVAGDFYDVFHFRDGTVGIAVADVAGKGLAASLIMASVKSVLPLLEGDGGVPGMIAALNAKLAGELSKREFVAMTLARYEPATGRLEFANAGLPDPYHMRDGSVSAISVDGPRLPLGIRRKVEWETVVVELRDGESVLFLTDGVPEAVVSEGEPLGYERLQALLESGHRDVDDILRSVAALATADDDQTLLMLTRTS